MIVETVEPTVTEFQTVKLMVTFEGAEDMRELYRRITREDYLSEYNRCWDLKERVRKLMFAQGIAP